VAQGASLVETPKSKLKVNRVGPDWRTAQRGTLQHATFEGESAAAFVDGEDIVVRMSCREDAPGLESSVPYAIAVTLEVADDIGVDIYTEVRERVRQRLQVLPSGPDDGHRGRLIGGYQRQEDGHSARRWPSAAAGIRAQRRWTSKACPLESPRSR
jgi:hypothetical protein